MNKYLLLITIILSFSMAAQVPSAEDIFSKLCTTLQVPKNKLPRLVILETNSSGAFYSKKNHTITLDKKLIDAFGSLQGYRSVAIAFVLGHELCHALEKDNKDTHFIAYDKSKGATFLNEQNADIQGAFVAYLSGYNCLPILPDVLETIYKAYNLKDNLPGYPSLQERAESISIIQEQVESLIAMYNSANLLMLTNYNSAAKSLFDKIYTYCPSPEIENSAAVNYILEAINLGMYKTLNYSLPLEIDWNLRLKKPGLPQGQKDLDPATSIKRDLLLKKAEIKLKKILETFPQYEKAIHNLICIKIVQSDRKNTQFLLSKLTSKSDEYYALSSILDLMNGQRSQAIKNTQRIKNERLVSLAMENINTERNKKENKPICNEFSIKPIMKQSTLLQQKQITIDSTTLSWTADNFNVKTHEKTVKYSRIIFDPKKCSPAIKYGNFEIWNQGVLGIANIESKSLQYYKID